MAFREKTTFVVGAGASAEFGLPIGTGLAAEIKKAALIRDINVSSEKSAKYMRDFIAAKFPLPKDRAEATAVAHFINEGLHTAVSIDAFIHRHRQTELVGRLGKALIALEVMKAEADSTMSMKHWPAFVKDPNHIITRVNKPNLVNPDYTWLGHFFRTMCDGIERPEEVGKNVTIICFNYDRCIEHYLTENLASAYRIERGEALRIVSANIEIIHPYGYLGRLTLREEYAGDNRLSYGFNLKANHDIEEISVNIRTYTEQAHDLSQIQRIHRGMKECKNLVFLGFGFNNQNLNLLRVKQTFDEIESPKSIYATAYGVYRQIEGTLKRRITDLFVDRKEHQYWRDSVQIEFGVGCEELFRIHDMNLSAFYEGFIQYDDADGDGSMISQTIKRH